MDPVYLLDVNVLVALLLAEHEHHDRASRWFKRLPNPRWATCPMTQAGFLRLASNAFVTFSPHSPGEAIHLLADNLKDSNHIFWPTHLGYREATAPFSHKLTGHRQVTDAYLLGLAMNKKAKLATMDWGIGALLPPEEASTWIAQI